MKKYKNYLIGVIGIVSSITSAQVQKALTLQVGNTAGIGQDASAALQIDDTERGLLVSRMTTLQRNSIVSPAKGLLIFNITTNTLESNIGTNVSPNWQIITTSAAVWSTTGNIGTSPTTNFIGTSDNNAVSIRTNNTEAVRVTNDGNVGIGTALPKSKLEVNGYIKIGSTDTSGDATPVAGMIRFNSITGKFQGYVNDSDSVTNGNQPGWVDLN